MKTALCVAALMGLLSGCYTSAARAEHKYYMYPVTIPADVVLSPVELPLILILLNIGPFK